MLVGRSFRIRSRAKDPPCHRLAESLRLLLFRSLELVEQLEKQKKGDLLDHGERARHAYLIILISDLSLEPSFSSSQSAVALSIRKAASSDERRSWIQNPATPACLDQLLKERRSERRRSVLFQRVKENLWKSPL